MTIIIDGKKIADQLCAELSDRIKSLSRPPSLTAIIVGDDPASHIYVKRKEAMAKKIGITSNVITRPANTTAIGLHDTIRWLNSLPTVDGILVQLPLPAHIDTMAIIEAIDPRKDVDGFHPLNAGRMLAGQPTFMPCTTMGIMKLLEASGTVLEGAKATMVGSGAVGKPTALALVKAGATVTIAHSKTPDLLDVCIDSDIIVSAVGKPNLIRRGYLPDRGAVVIDVGINRLPDGRIVGDVAFDECMGVAKAMTPVPGGVGPMTIACLMENTVKAARLRA
jgi:methylenetetrahydrofolate dehydrogenase (NADP+) / methenyltetrahydrofolate cyclohydrolase